MAGQDERQRDPALTSRRDLYFNRMEQKFIRIRAFLIPLIFICESSLKHILFLKNSHQT